MAWFRAAAAWTWTLLRRISVSILGCTSSQAFRDSLNGITLFDVIKATSLVLRLQPCGTAENEVLRSLIETGLLYATWKVNLA
jgi:hypothetical protein